jgi:hypothetical protein
LPRDERPSLRVARGRSVVKALRKMKGRAVQPPPVKGSAAFASTQQ